MVKSRFTDLDGDNVWDQNEPFDDRGRLFLDLNANGTYESGLFGDQLIADVAPGNYAMSGDIDHGSEQL